MPVRTTHRFRVRYAECDAQGVVFNAHYLAYFDLGLTELWRAALGSYDAMLELGADVVVVEATVRYRAPARFDDVVDIATWVAQLGTTSLRIGNRLTRAADGVPLAEGEVAYVCVDLDGVKQPVPPPIREALGPTAPASGTE